MTAAQRGRAKNQRRTFDIPAVPAARQQCERPRVLRLDGVRIYSQHHRESQESDPTGSVHMICLENRAPFLCVIYKKCHLE